MNNTINNLLLVKLNPNYCSFLIIKEVLQQAKLNISL